MLRWKVGKNFGIIPSTIINIEGMPVPAVLEQIATEAAFSGDGVLGVPGEEGCWNIPAWAKSYPGFRRWVLADGFPDKVRVTSVAQEIYLDMSKEDLSTHADVKVEVSRVLLQQVRDRNEGRLFLDGVLISHPGSELSNNPDGVYVSRQALAANRCRLLPGANRSGRPDEIEGSPDWVLEIVSDGSVRKDKVQLRQAYFEAGIPEYWLIDTRGELIEFEILVAAPGGYATVPVDAGWSLSPTFGQAFRLEREHDDLFGWKYSLKVRGSGRD